MYSVPITFPSFPFLFDQERFRYLTDKKSACPISMRLSPDPISFAQIGIERILAEARSRFLLQLLNSNGSLTDRVIASILEIDTGKSLLTQTLRNKGVNSLKATPQEIFTNQFPPNAFGILVTHNLLHRFANKQEALLFLEKVAPLARGMIHQMPAVDDPPTGFVRPLSLAFSGEEWSKLFIDFSSQRENMFYYGAHRGLPHRPLNHVIGNGLEAYLQYERHPLRILCRELTLANTISLSRVPFIVASFAIAQDKPELLAGLLSVGHAMDALDGFVSRRWGLGNSPYGETIDWGVDHAVEEITLATFVNQGLVPDIIFWIITIRNILTDYPRIMSLIQHGPKSPESHPHESFGTKGKLQRALYGVHKGVGDALIPIWPEGRVFLSITHVLHSLARAKPVIASSQARGYYRDLYKVIHAEMKKRRKLKDVD